jgi:hypothetical protein
MPKRRLPRLDHPPAGSYTLQEQLAMAQGDALRDRILKRTGFTREQLQCPREKTWMTPCVARDGGLAVCFVHSRPACVGCEWSLKAIDAKEDEAERTPT